MNQEFAQNLRLLCSYYKSITEVTARLQISRPQFNRYLSAKHRPNANTLRRICDFFGVEEHEILLPHNQFKRLIQVRPRQPVREENSVEQPHLQVLQQRSSAEIDKYLGYYFEYYLSMSAPGKILRALVCIERRGQGVYYQRTERLIEEGENKGSHCKYQGVAYYLLDRIFMQDYESLTANEMTQTTLFPTFKSRVTWLYGMRMGVSSSGERAPCCARIVLEYLGGSVDLRKALKLCKLYDYHSNSIDETIRQAIDNSNPDDPWHFRARAH